MKIKKLKDNPFFMNQINFSSLEILVMVHPTDAGVLRDFLPPIHLLRVISNRDILMVLECMKINKKILRFKEIGFIPILVMEKLLSNRIKTSNLLSLRKMKTQKDNQDFLHNLRKEL